MREADFFARQVGPRLKSWGTYDRLENGLAGGIPDVNYVVGEVHGWLETKVVHSGKVYFEKFQLPWLFKRARFMPQGLWVLATNDRGDRLWLWNPETLSQAPRTVVKKWTVLEVKDLRSSIGDTLPLDWKSVHLRLQGL